MRRSMGLLGLLFLGIGAGCMPVASLTQAPAAETTSGERAAEEAAKYDYDPLIEGATWRYRSTSGEVTSEITTRIFNVETTSGVTTAESETTTTSDGETATFSGTSKRMADRSESTDTASGVTTVFKLPLTVGKTWTSGTWVFKVEGREAVTVPFGSFTDALKVTRRRGTSTTTLWMVDQVGTVRITGPAEGGGTVVIELVSFEKPGD